MLLACCALLWLGCVDDPNLDEPTEDTGGADVGSGDAGGDADAGTGADAGGCPDDEVPVDGDACDCAGETRDASDELCERTCDCSGGFWACEETCDEPEPLALRVVGEPTLAEDDGNGDALVQRGETWLVRAEVAADNAGASGADVVVRLQSDDIFLELPAQRSRVDLSGLTDTPQTVELAFVVDPAAPQGETALVLEVTSGFALESREVPVTISGPNAPALRWGDVEFERIEGDADRQIELGERWQLVATLRNEGDRSADDLALTATASSSALMLDEDAFNSPREVASGGSVFVRWRFDVAADLVELEPVIDLRADATDAMQARTDVAVPLVPPDTLAVVATRWSGVQPDLTLEVDVQNEGALDVTGLAWTRINYASPTPCGNDGEPACEEPFLESLELGAADGPSSIAAGAIGTVTMALTRDEDTPPSGRVLVRAMSSLRQHGPYPIDVTVPTE